MLDARTTQYGGVTLVHDALAGSGTSKRLVRNAVGVPLDETDGDVLWTYGYGSALGTPYVDTGLTAGRFYYYALFTLVGGVWSRVDDVTVLVTRDYGHTRRLYTELPEVFRSSDFYTVDLQDADDETTFLWKFLSVFGYQLDDLHTETDTLRVLLNAQLVNQRMLPALAQQVGVQYEPTVGTRALRRLVANAAHLYGLKGTLPATRELANVLTGYPAHVRIGANIALDSLDAGPSTDRGRWRGRTNATVSYRARTATEVLPVDAGGVRVITAAATGSVVVDTNLAGTAVADRPTRLQYAIPVVAGLGYTASHYVRTSATGVTARSGITWLDKLGAPIGSVYTDSVVTVDTSWSARPVTYELAPAGAVYLEPSLLVDGLSAGATVETCGFQVRESASDAPWKPARQALIYLDANLVNYVGNTSGAAGNANGWSAGVGVVVDATLGNYLTPVAADSYDQFDSVLSNAFVVDYPGDTAPAAPAPTSTTAVTTVWYEAAVKLVQDGESWSVLGEVLQPASDAPGTVRFARAAFRLFDGPDMVGTQLGPLVQLTRGSFTPVSCELDVPEGAGFDRVQAALVFDGLCGFRKVALEPVPLRTAFFFDGSTPSATGDYLWQGTPFASPSAYYPRRAARTVRLRELLRDFLPHGSSYDLVFGVAPDAIPASPQAVGGADVDPATAPPTAVGARLRARWNVKRNP